METTIMENQMENKMENEMETGGICIDSSSYGACNSPSHHAFLNPRA